MTFFNNLARYGALAGLTALLSACGGGGGDNTGELSLGITDQPATGNEKVCLHFTTITLHHSDGERIVIPYDPSTYYDPADGCIDNVDPALGDASGNAIELSALQGVLSAPLMDTETVKAGFYNWIRLDVDETLSYVIDPEGNQQDLKCPSCGGDQSGFKLNKGITVPAGGAVDYMIDIDLAKSLNRKPAGDYSLRPTLRLINLAEVGHIAGSVAGSLIPGMISETETGCSVYVYAGHDVVPDDNHAADNVLASFKVLYDPGTMSFGYVAAYLPTDPATDPTPYTLALTCDVDDADVDQNNDPLAPTGTDVIFTDGITEGVGQNGDAWTDQTNTEVHFPPVI